MDKIIIPTVIEDSLGLISGISILKTRVIYDTEGDWIKITGRLSANTKAYSSWEFEPDIQADIVNKKDQVCVSKASEHEGCFVASQKVSFTIDIQNVTNYISWDEILKIQMYLIYRYRNRR